MTSTGTYLRIVQLDGILNRGDRVTGHSLAARFDISTRQVYRLMEMLRDQFRAPLAYDRREKTYYYTEKTFQLPAALLTEREGLSLLSAHGILDGMPILPLSAELADATLKLRRFLPSTLSMDVTPWMAGFSSRTSSHAEVSRMVLDTLANALTERRGVTLKYYSAYNDSSTDRSVDLYHITLRNNNWYAIGYCHLRHALRTFVVHRVRAAQVEKRTYKIPDDFSPERHFQSAFGVEFFGPAEEVVIDFDPYEARWIRERTWHAGQLVEDRPDGGLRLRMKVSLGVELEKWILSFGEHARVVRPVSLRKQVANRLRAALCEYDE